MTCLNRVFDLHTPPHRKPIQQQPFDNYSSRLYTHVCPKKLKIRNLKYPQPTDQHARNKCQPTSKMPTRFRKNNNSNFPGYVKINWKVEKSREVYVFIRHRAFSTSGVSLERTRSRSQATHIHTFECLVFFHIRVACGSWRRID